MDRVVGDNLNPKDLPHALGYAGSPHMQDLPHTLSFELSYLVTYQFQVFIR